MTESSTWHVHVCGRSNHRACITSLQITSVAGNHALTSIGSHPEPHIGSYKMALRELAAVSSASILDLISSAQSKYG